MSAANLPVLKSASGQTLTINQLRSLAKDVIRRAIRKAVTEVVKEYNRHVALDTGALRARLEDMLLSQVSFKGNSTRINIKFNMAEMRKLNYAEYHIDGRPYHKGDMSAYRDPNTSGTRPIQTREIMDLIAKRTKLEIEKGLRSLGL